MKKALDDNIVVPSFKDLWESYLINLTGSGRPDSLTTLLQIDQKRGIVIKAYLTDRLTEALQKGAASPSIIKTGREAEMLQMLQEVGIRAPRVLAFNDDRTAFAMDFIPGQLLLEWMQSNELTGKDIDKIACLAIDIQNKLEQRKEMIKVNFPPYPSHTGNVTLFLDETLKRIKDESWVPHLQGEIRRKFINSVQILSQRFLEKPEYYNAGDAICGDLAVNNLIRGENDELTVIDPLIGLGRKSMDLARLGRSMIVSNIEAFKIYFPLIVSRFNALADHPVSSSEVIDMLRVDLLRTMSTFLNIPDDQLSFFPRYVKEASRDKLRVYIDDIIPQLLVSGEIKNDFI